MTAAQTGATLLVVSTPIGNLEDMSPRAQRALADCAVIAAEDTRRTRQLLSHFGLKKPLIALHEHSSAETIGSLLERLKNGETIALVSDAGTPLISDPGYELVTRAIDRGVAIATVPGPSAVTAALTVAGLPTDRFLFAGFLPARAGPRRHAIGALAAETATLVLFESVHRLAPALSALADGLGPDRRAAVCRELTKRFETVYRGTLEELAAAAASGEIEPRGEFVVVVAGAEPRDPDAADLERVLAILLQRVSVSDAAGLAAKILGLSRKRAYAAALRLAGE